MGRFGDKTPKKMDYILNGIKMDTRVMKHITRMGKKMDYILNGMIMDRRNMKKLGRMGKRFLKNVGMKMEMKKSEIKPHSIEIVLD